MRHGRIKLFEKHDGKTVGVYIQISEKASREYGRMIKDGEVACVICRNTVVAPDYFVISQLILTDRSLLYAAGCAVCMAPLNELIGKLMENAQQARSDKAKELAPVGSG